MPEADVRYSRLNRQYVKTPASAFTSGSKVNPTAGTVEFAFMLRSAPDDETSSADPGTPDWYPGEWETAPGSPHATYFARVLVGPGGGVPLGVGFYDVWVHITNAPEAPVVPAGLLEIF